LIELGGVDAGLVACPLSDLDRRYEVGSLFGPVNSLDLAFLIVPANSGQCRLGGGKHPLCP
jgi:hypothetical protein